MLSNRGWLVKFLLPMLGFAALCAHAAWVMPATRLDVAECLVHPGKHDGRTVWMPPREVGQNHPDGSFTTVGRGLTVRVKADYVPGTGKYVSVKGVFRKPDLVVVAKGDMQENAWHTLQRGGVYGVSGAVLLAWMGWFLRRFRLGVAGGLFHPRADAPPPDGPGMPALPEAPATPKPGEGGK